MVRPGRNARSVSARMSVMKSAIRNQRGTQIPRSFSSRGHSAEPTAQSRRRGTATTPRMGISPVSMRRGRYISAIPKSGTASTASGTSWLPPGTMPLGYFDHGRDLRVCVAARLVATVPRRGPGSGPPWSRRLAPGPVRSRSAEAGRQCVIAKSLPFARRKVVAIMNERPILPIFEVEFPFQVEFAIENCG